MSPDPSETRAVVFDAYGTLLDVHSAVARHADAVGPDAARLSEIWRGKQLEYTWVLSLAGRYEPFWTLTERALAFALARCPSVDPALAPRLLDAYRALDAFPDAVPLLRRLSEGGVHTAILSNGDPGMLAAALASSGLAEHLDAVLSVEAVRVFKTSPAAYGLVETSLRVPRGKVLFVSSNRWDVAGAAAFGFRCAWVNRAGLPDEYAELPPAVTVQNLDGLSA